VRSSVDPMQQPMHVWRMPHQHGLRKLLSDAELCGDSSIEGSILGSDEAAPLLPRPVNVLRPLPSARLVAASEKSISLASASSMQGGLGRFRSLGEREERLLKRDCLGDTERPSSRCVPRRRPVTRCEAASSRIAPGLPVVGLALAPRW
jgi:hypothetical protein